MRALSRRTAVFATLTSVVWIVFGVMAARPHIVHAAPISGAPFFDGVQGPTAQDQLDQQFLATWATQRRVPLAIPAAHGRVVVVKFNDWMCPGCKAAYETFKPILDKYRATAGTLTYIEKDWPWNSRCNSAVAQTFRGHEAACDAAAAVRLAAEKGNREAMITWLLANQEGMTPEKVQAKTVELLGIKDFAAAYARTLPEIRKDIAEGRAININSTPTYFINGVRFADDQGRTLPPHYLELAIQYELKKGI